MEISGGGNERANKQPNVEKIKKILNERENERERLLFRNCLLFNDILRYIIILMKIFKCRTVFMRL